MFEPRGKSNKLKRIGLPIAIGMVVVISLLIGWNYNLNKQFNANVVLGDKYLNEGKLDDAATYYVKALSYKKNSLIQDKIATINCEQETAMGDKCLSEGKIDEAVTDYNTALSFKQDSVTQEKLANVTYQHAIELVGHAEWDKAIEILQSLQQYNYKDSKALYIYATAEKQYYQSYDGHGITEYMIAHIKPVLDSLNQISPDYSGQDADYIKTFRTDLESELVSLQASLDESKQADKVADTITPGSRKLYLGMTPNAAEVSMGKPENINRMTGSYGVHEQWCYPGNVYLYFDDGELTSWQD
jgi:tetratricopeptide (TPR) repeat protein